MSESGTTVWIILVSVCIVLMLCFIFSTLCVCCCVSRSKIFPYMFYLLQKIKCKKSFADKKSEEIYSDVYGVVLEIGPANGDLFNILRSCKDIEEWIGIEQNEISLKLLDWRLRKEFNDLPFKTRYICDSSMEKIESDSIDCVIIRHVMCNFSKESSKVFISDLHRVLKPGGAAYLLEHVKYRRNFLGLFLQRLCFPCMYIYGDGCRTTNETESFFDDFSDKFHVKVEYTEFSTLLACFQPHIFGTVVKLENEKGKENKIEDKKENEKKNSEKTKIEIKIEIQEEKKEADVVEDQKDEEKEKEKKVEKEKGEKDEN